MSELKDTVWDFGVGTSLAHLHGCVCGLSCTPAALDDEGYLRSLVDLLGDEIPGVEVGAAYDELIRFCRAALTELDDEDYGFSLLLSDDEIELPDRLGELADWCAGFLLGFGGGVDTQELGEIGREVLDDIVEVSRVDPDSEVDPRVEFELFDVVEHLRIGVLTLRSGALETDQDDDAR